MVLEDRILARARYPGGPRKRDPALNMDKWIMGGRTKTTYFDEFQGPPAPGPGPLNWRRRRPKILMLCCFFRSNNGSILMQYVPSVTNAVILQWVTQCTYNVKIYNGNTVLIYCYISVKRLRKTAEVAYVSRCHPTLKTCFCPAKRHAHYNQRMNEATTSPMCRGLRYGVTANAAQLRYGVTANAGQLRYCVHNCVSVSQRKQRSSATVSAVTR
jgi:hypothetical protein